ncbi:hypothetical protein FC699_38040, partial [Bacillus wiedmannii]
KGTVIGISTTHSLETIIGILGILKAGAVYLPIDPQYPSERVNYMLQDSDINILFTNFDISHQWDLSLYAVEVIHINAAHI